MRDWAKNQVTAVWIRHGATEANRERRYLFSSPMKRCLQTAEILYPGFAPVLIPEWEEMDFGRFELKNYQELKEDAYYRAFLAEPRPIVSEGEADSHRFFANRACKYFPCHKGLSDFNCLFCCCPLYPKEDCPGNPRFLERGGGYLKDCTDCTFPHRPENYDVIVQRLAKER